MLRQLINSLWENWPFHEQWERMHANPFVLMIFFFFALFFAFARFAPNTTDQVNSTHFVFSTSTQTVTLKRTETKKSWYKTGVHFNRQKEKKNYIKIQNRNITIPWACAQRRWERQSSMRTNWKSMVFPSLADRPGLPSLFQTREVFSMCNSGKSQCSPLSVAWQVGTLAVWKLFSRAHFTPGAGHLGSRPCIEKHKKLKVPHLRKETTVKTFPEGAFPKLSEIKHSFP